MRTSAALGNPQTSACRLRPSGPVGPPLSVFFTLRLTVAASSRPSGARAKARSEALRCARSGNERRKENDAPSIRTTKRAELRSPLLACPVRAAVPSSPGPEATWTSAFVNRPAFFPADSGTEVSSSGLQGLQECRGRLPNFRSSFKTFRFPGLSAADDGSRLGEFFAAMPSPGMRKQEAEDRSAPSSRRDACGSAQRTVRGRRRPWAFGLAVRGPPERAAGNERTAADKNGAAQTLRI